MRENQLTGTAGLVLRALFAALLLSALWTAWPMPVDAETRKTETFHWQGTLKEGARVEINGVNGHIIATPSAGDEVIVDAVKSGRRSDPTKVRIQTIEDSDGITICAVYPGIGNSCEPGDKYHSHTHNNDVEVEFTVKIPTNARFHARTVNGGVEISGLRGPVKATTVNGNVTLETTGPGSANTVNGSVRATIGKPDPSEDLEFETVNGSVSVIMPANVNANLEGSTVNGSISSDFPVTISGKWGPRNMHGTIGKGGPTLRMSSVNGSIHLRRSARTSL